MRTLATKQPSHQDSAHKKPVRATPVPVARSLFTGLTDSTDVRPTSDLKVEPESEVALE